MISAAQGNAKIVLSDGAAASAQGFLSLTDSNRHASPGGVDQTSWFRFAPGTHFMHI
jgi:hypothetical protein